MKQDREPDSRRVRIVGLILVVALCAASTFLRARAAFADPGFDARSPVGMLRSDPALLFDFTQRIVASGGTLWDGARADPTLEFPATVDVPAHFTLGIEFVAAWSQILLGGDTPLHVTSTWAAAASASTALFGVYLLAVELSGSVVLGLLAALLAGAMPANHRTLGFVLMSEDLALPLFVLHLALLARAARVRTAASALIAALALVAAAATWHAIALCASLEAACVLAWFLRTGRNPCALPASRAFVAALLAGATLVPVLRATHFALSFALAVVWAFAIAAWTSRRRGLGRRGETVVVLAVIATVSGAAWILARATGGGQGDLAHVFDLLWAKIAHFGRRPSDPTELGFDARIMWQGPFATLDARAGLRALGVSACAALPAAWIVWRDARAPRANPGVPVTSLLALAGLGAAWLVERVLVLPALLLPAVAAAACGSFDRGRARVLFAAAVLAQVFLFQAWLGRYTNPWYEPPIRQREIAALIRAIPRHVPPGAAIAGDFVSATAILAHTGHPIVLQPKWERVESRRRIERFFDAFYRASPQGLRALLVGTYQCRYLVVDRALLGGSTARYAAGFQDSEPLVPGSASEALLAEGDDAALAVPGYHLLYRSPPTLRARNGERSDFFRLYALDP